MKFLSFIFDPSLDRIAEKWPAIGEPEFLQKVHSKATSYSFILAFPICIFLSNSLPIVVFLSVYAIVTGHWSSWQAARTEVRQKEADRQMQETMIHIEEMLERLRRLDKEAPFTDSQS